MNIITITGITIDDTTIIIVMKRETWKGLIITDTTDIGIITTKSRWMALLLQLHQHKHLKIRFL
eukprot:EC723149.1.p4 GENE.EC723149.1~~EC723149.1.p4  ORF type:complete len:64 (+),score=14.18 EC723149.1:107-298(+)